MQIEREMQVEAGWGGGGGGQKNSRCWNLRIPVARHHMETV